jgi:hypothetical protein
MEIDIALPHSYQVQSMDLVPSIEPAIDSQLVMGSSTSKGSKKQRKSEQLSSRHKATIRYEVDYFIDNFLHKRLMHYQHWTFRRIGILDHLKPTTQLLITFDKQATEEIISIETKQLIALVHDCALFLLSKDFGSLAIPLCSGLFNYLNEKYSVAQEISISAFNPKMIQPFIEKDADPLPQFKIRKGPAPSANDFERIEQQTIISDPIYSTQLCLFKGVIDREKLSKLVESTKRLCNNFPKASKNQTARKENLVYHFGSWCDSSPHPKNTSDTRHSAATKWISENENLFSLMNVIFEDHFPNLFKHYSKISSSNRHLQTFGAWCSVAVNINFASSYHSDRKDNPNGLCWVLPFGTYSRGGELNLEQLKCTIAFRPGDVVCFKSRDIYHWNSDFDNVRNSLVFFTHDNMFKYKS